MVQRKFQDFNDKARKWDLKPENLTRSELVAENIRDKLALDKNKTEVLDFGCGTGRIDFLLSHRVRHITAVDGSVGMIEELQKKIFENGILNITTQCFDLEHELRLLSGKKFDLIMSMMVLHHLEDPEKIIGELWGLLKDDGVVCLIDLDAEDGSFHGDDPFVPHNGFDREEFQAQLEKAGFFKVTFHTPYIIKRKNKAGELKEYPLFMAIASKYPTAELLGIKI